MPKNPKIKKVLVLGSGPIVIGQAAEFDYAGTQACRALKEEGVEVVISGRAGEEKNTIRRFEELRKQHRIQLRKMPRRRCGNS